MSTDRLATLLDEYAQLERRLADPAIHAVLHRFGWWYLSPQNVYNVLRIHALTSGLTLSPSKRRGSR